ncbi:solute carrier family 28 member 3-like isoform X2 [Haliotis rubra]|uniref:solute carrier family 28 member 3-like isoform X2 n=1 Tax=Haliotis rubra TaxID=36100 RepID=UPI001EE53222|nr:solute carrier family 28 member 3-like isoform X2 [Haliotis rubra]
MEDADVKTMPEKSLTEKKMSVLVNPAFENDSSDCERNGNEPEEPEDRGNLCSRGVGTLQTAVTSAYTKHEKAVWMVIKFLLMAGYIGYFGYAMYYRFGDEGSYRLMVVTVLGVLIILWGIGGGSVMNVINSFHRGCVQYHGRNRCRIFSISVRWFLYVCAAVFIGVYTGVEIGMNQPRNLMSLIGIASLIFVMYITSTDPARVNWHPVFWGMAIQYIFACLILKTAWGYGAFDWLGKRMTEVLGYSNTGAQFVFGDSYEDHMFAFKVLPVIVYFSSLIAVLYYIGAMQYIIRVLGKFLAFCLDTKATESLNAAGNIFAGMTECPLMIRPFLPLMTKSELHAVMTGGFATVSGSVLGAYVTYGVKANHLLAASVMSAPAALAISKLTYPETETSDIDPDDVYKLQMDKPNNVIEAASNGASVSISLVANVAVNVMAFLALLQLVDASLIFLGDRVGVENLTFQLICSYVFYPISFVMGIDPVDCRRMARLIGFKTFTNEFVAYIEMGKLIDNGHVFDNYTATLPNASWVTQPNDDIFLTDWGQTLVGGIMLPRSQVIATYALCGFSNLGSMGIQIGGLGAMAPSRKSDLTAMALRAMIAGNVACFLTACIAGLFYSGEL